MSQHWGMRLREAEQRRQGLLREGREARREIANLIAGARADGWSMIQIADEIGVDRGSAYQLLAHADPVESPLPHPQ